MPLAFFIQFNFVIQTKNLPLRQSHSLRKIKSLIS